jgi:hypothetical protein
VSQELYGSVQYDWVVIVSAGITRLRDQWPLSDKQVYDYAESIYGNDLNSIHHYETKEVRDSEDRLILPAGQIVDEDFSFVYTDIDKNYSNTLSKISYTEISIENTPINTSIIKVNLSKNNVKIGDELLINGIYIPVISSTNDIINNTKVITLSSPIPIDVSEGSTLTFKFNNTILIETNPVTGISNYEYEVLKNNEKKSIYVLKPRYLQQVINDTRKAMIYDRSSQYVNDTLIKTENTKVSIPF